MINDLPKALAVYAFDNSISVMIFLLVLSSFLYPSTKPYYPLHLTGNESSVKSFVKIINRELGGSEIIRADKILQAGEYGIKLLHRNNTAALATRHDRFLCALNYLLGDSSRSFRLKLVENEVGILIGDGMLGVIDMADIAKFEMGEEESFTAGSVLLHEIYEQFYLQALGKLTPGRVSQSELKKAHLAATQKESNLYDLLMVKTESIMNDDFIYIEFESRLDDCKINCRKGYYAYYSNGNIDRVMRETNTQY